MDKIKSKVNWKKNYGFPLMKPMMLVAEVLPIVLLVFYLQMLNVSHI